MSSVQSGFAQPKTRTFVVTQDESNGERGPYMFTQEAIDNWLSNESSNLSVVGSLVTISGNFENIIDNLSPGGTPTFAPRKSLLDLGKEYVIGSPQESRLVVLRKVRAPGPAVNAGDYGSTFYVVVENNCSDTPYNNGRFTVRVARV